MSWRAHRGLGIAVTVFLLVAWAGTAQATPHNQKVYKQTHPEKTAVSCKLCHEGLLFKWWKLNNYGLALQAFKGRGNAKQLTKQDFKEFETATPQPGP